MIVDSSVLLAILFEEEESDTIFNLLLDENISFLSAANYLETSIVFASKLQQADFAKLDLLLGQLGITIISVTKSQAEIAQQAFLAYGKGRHKAGLNFGDCFAYALAKEKNQPLLFKGDDFSKTDIEIAAY